MAPAIPGFNFVWVDDFNGATGLPDQKKWNIIQKGPNRKSGEVQTYTASTQNVSLTGSGQLHITPQKDGNGNWTSARLEGVHDFSCPDNGKMILQAELRTGIDPVTEQAGVWPAFWALGGWIRSHNTPWPECGEWDIMENSSGAGFTLASLHYGPDGDPAHEKSQGGQLNSAAEKSMPVEEFNTYSLMVDRTLSRWQDETLTWSLNGKPWFSVKGSDVNDHTFWTNCAHKAFFPIVNVAIGTNFPGSSNNGQPNTQTVTGLGSGMQVLYVAFYKSQ